MLYLFWQKSKMNAVSDGGYCFLDRIYRINWIFFLGRSPEESDQTPIACGEGERTHKFIGNYSALRNCLFVYIIY